MMNQLIDQVLDSPKSEGDQTLVFNKVSGALVSSICGSHLDLVNTDFCKGKVVKFNPETHSWVGDFDTGSLKANVETARTANEQTLDSKAQHQIRNKYDYYHQLNIIIDTLSLLLDASSLTAEQRSSFDKMQEYISETRALNNRYKDSYKNDPNWTYKTKEDAQADTDQQLAGGLYEVIKPQQNEYLP